MHDSEVKQVFYMFYEKDDGDDFLGVLHTNWEQQVLVTTH